MKNFEEVYLLSGEIVTIFLEDGCYNYKHTMLPELYICGSFFKLADKAVSICPIPKPPSAVKEAFEELGYKVL